MPETVSFVIDNCPCVMQVREYKGQRVVTFRDIDQVHERPEGTAARNFSFNRRHFVEGVDFFRVTPADASSTKNVDLNAPNGLTAITESGYLMLVKSLTDDRAWEVQRALVASYFRVKETAAEIQEITSDPLALLELQVKALREHQNRIEVLEARTRAEEAARAEQAKQIETLGHRVTNLDLADIDGTPRQRLVAMIKRYAWVKKITYPQAWRHFDTAFSTAFRVNLTARRQNYARSNGVDKVERPEYLEASGLIEDAIRVASKMLDADGKQVTA